MVLWKELGGNLVGEKSVAGGIGVGNWEDPRWAKKSTPHWFVCGGGEGREGGGGEDFEKKHSSCTVAKTRGPYCC